jgi:FKBP-type peptidyl-prolyl cis-trans isomerase FkpA
MEMKKGIEAEDVVVGSGGEALRGKTVIARVRVFLTDGTELTDALLGGPRVKINLRRRECIAGVRYGIEGMRVGGVRRLVIAPHLAYGPHGVPGRVPPYASLRCEVELLEVRESDVMKPEDYPPGRHLLVFHPGEAARNLPRWQFHLEEDGRGGAAIDFPIPGMTWRHTRRRAVNIQMDQAEAAALFQSAITLPSLFPAECLTTEELWADATEPANSITRDSRTNSRCITITVSERGQNKSHYAMSERSRALLDSELYRVITSLLQPHLVNNAGPGPTSGNTRRLPQ